MVSDLYRLVSVSEFGDIGNGNSFSARLSLDGTLVSFYSDAENLVDNDFATGRNLFVKNLITGEVKILDVDRNGETFRDSQLNSFDYFPDNKSVVFSSEQQGLTSESGDISTVYLIDLETGTTSIISRNSAGEQGEFHSFGPQVIKDPSVYKLGFMSFSSNFIPNDAIGPNGSAKDIYIKGLDTGALQIVSTSKSGVLGNNDHQESPVFSYTGNKVLFYSFATNLIDGETTSAGNVFLKNVVTGDIEILDSVPVVNYAPTGIFSKDDNFLKIGDEVLNLLTKEISSLSDAGLTEEDFNYNPPQNTDYEVIVTNHSLLPEDTNHFFDVYLKDLNTGLINEAPVAKKDVTGILTEREITLNILANDFDADGDDLNITRIWKVDAGNNVVINPDKTITYSAAENFRSSDYFYYEITDGKGGFSTSSVQVSFLNTPPVAKDDEFTGNQDVAIMGNVLSNNGYGADSDANGDPLTVISGTYATANGSITLAKFGTFTYTPKTGFYGIDTFEYTVEDGQGGSDKAIVTFNIREFNQEPIANKDRLTAPDENEFTIDVLANDFDANGDALSISRVWKVGEGNSVVINPDNTLTYTGGDDFKGTDYFYYEITDSRGGFSTSSVFINAPPEAHKDRIAPTYERELTLDVLANDFDANGHALSISNIWKVDGGNSAIINPDDTITFKAGDGFYGSDYFYYEVTDGHGGKSTSSVQVSFLEPDIKGDSGDNVLTGTSAQETIFGDAGADVFAFNSTAFDALDSIIDFDKAEGDKLDISDVLSGYDPLTDAITDFVQITDNGTDSTLSVDSDGGADNFVAIATLSGIIGLTDEDALETSGNLVTV